MALNVKNFVIQAKAIEADEGKPTIESFGVQEEDNTATFSDSVKEEIIDECVEKIITYLESKNKL